MSNAIERARRLQEELSQLKVRKTERHQSEYFEMRREELRRVWIKLDAAVVPLLILMHRGRVVASALPKTSLLTIDLEEVTRRARDEAPEAITKGREYERLCSGALKLSRDVEELVNSAWDAFRAELPAVSTIPLAEIAQIPGQAAAVDTVRQLDEAVKKGVQKPPSTEAEYDALLAHIEKLRAALAQLSEKSFPPEVRRFVIEALRPTGADRALLTPNVLEWLEKRQLAHRVRLRLFEEQPPSKPSTPTRGGRK